MVFGCNVSANRQCIQVHSCTLLSLLTRGTQRHPLLPGNRSGAQAASASPQLHEIKHKTLIEADRVLKPD